MFSPSQSPCDDGGEKSRAIRDKPNCPWRHATTPRNITNQHQKWTAQRHRIQTLNVLERPELIHSPREFYEAMHSPPADDYPVNWSSWIQQWIDHTASSPHFEPRTPQPASTKRPFNMGNTPPPSMDQSPGIATPRKRRRGARQDEPERRHLWTG